MRAVVTGAAGGIGQAVVRRLAAPGAQLLLVDQNEDALAEPADAARKAGARVATAAIDLSSVEAGDLVASAARVTLDGVDALISNAGIMASGTLASLAFDDYERSFAVNTRATWLLAKALHPRLAETRGSLVATASLAADFPVAAAGVYSATKAALIMLVKQLANEWGPDGIRCNCVSPGSVYTQMNPVYGDEERRAARGAAIPLGRMGTADEIAAVIAFLAGPDAVYISGIDLVVDGALTTTLMAPATLR